MLEMIFLDQLFRATRSCIGVSSAALLLLPPRFTASLCTARDLKSIEAACDRLLRGLVEKGPCFCWVFTVTNKTQLVQYDRQHWFYNRAGRCLVGSWQGEELEMEKLNPLPCYSRGDKKALQCVRHSIRNAKPRQHRVPSAFGRGPHQATCTQKMRKVRQNGGFPPVHPRAGWLLHIIYKTQD